MRADRSVVGAVGLGALVTVATYPAVGPASLSLGVTAFFMYAAATRRRGE